MFPVSQPSRRTVIILAAIVFIALGETLTYRLFKPSRVEEPVPRGELTAEQARAYMLQNQNLVLIDVRSRKEFAADHLPDALNIPIHSLPRLLAQIPRDHPVLVYCVEGFRAIQAYKLLKRLRPDLSNIRYVAGWLLSFTPS